MNAPGGIGIGTGSSIENWACELTIPNAHERTIYSVSFGPARRRKGTKDSGVVEGKEEIGWLASAGGDEKVNIWSISVCLHIYLSGEVYDWKILTPL